MKSIIVGIITIAVALLAPQITQAQGTMTYLSNLDQASAGSLAVGSDSSVAAGFETGTDASGYSLNSIQLAMTDSLGNPSGFTVLLYSAIVGTVNWKPFQKDLGTFSGSLSPATGGIFTYTPASSLTLSPSTRYFIVLTAGTAVANGDYEWSYVGANSYNPSDGWSSLNVVWTSSNPFPIAGNPQFAINAIVAPEPGALGLFGLGGLAFLWHRRKAKAI